MVEDGLKSISKVGEHMIMVHGEPMAGMVCRGRAANQNSTRNMALKF